MKNQHSSISNSLAEVISAKIINSKVGSKELTFFPSNLKEVKFENKTYVCDCNSAGSIGLMIQQLLPCLILSNGTCSLRLVGGTIVSHSPSTYYISTVLEPILERMNITYKMEVLKHGIFPLGQGKVLLNTTPSKEIAAMNITERGRIKKVLTRLVSTNNFSIVDDKKLYKNLVKDVRKSVEDYYKKQGKLHNEEETDLDIFEEEYIDISEMKKGNTLFGQIVLYFENTVISSEKTFSEKKETNEIKNFKSDLLIGLDRILLKDKVCFDEFTVDHLIIFLVFAKGKSVIHVGDLSLHTLTAIDIIKKFVPNLNISIEKFVDYTKIEVEGIGYMNDL